MAELFCQIHGFYDGSYGTCPTCSGGAKKPPTPTSLNDDVATIPLKRAGVKSTVPSKIIWFLALLGIAVLCLVCLGAGFGIYCVRNSCLLPYIKSSVTVTKNVSTLVSATPQVTIFNPSQIISLPPLITATKVTLPSIITFTSTVSVTSTLTKSPSPKPPTTTPTPTRSPSPKPPTITPSSVNWMVMVHVPAGDFSMGNDNSFGLQSKDYDFGPTHNVYLDDFWIDKTEVTNAMYAKCVVNGKCSPPHKTSAYLTTTSSIGNYYGSSTYANYPVVYVSWESANKYCAWAGKRLPTEAEWEKAARGTNGRLYPWGSDAPTCDRAKSYDCSPFGTVEVGKLTAGASPYGALDMVGNVWEWVSDYYSADYYRYSPSSNPTGPSSGNAENQHVVRGGGAFTGSKSISDFSAVARSFGNLNEPASDPKDLWLFINGFRCASNTQK
jgi:formylglycine-generating enzyme required for sulfatase activity